MAKFTHKEREYIDPIRPNRRQRRAAMFTGKVRAYHHKPHTPGAFGKSR